MKSYREDQLATKVSHRRATMHTTGASGGECRSALSPGGHGNDVCRDHLDVPRPEAAHLSHTLVVRHHCAGEVCNDVWAADVVGQGGRLFQGREECAVLAWHVLAHFHDE